MLAARRLTEAQLREKLVKREFPAEEIESVIERARELRYLDDAEYARAYLRSQAKGRGDRRVIGDLVKRGLDRETALAALREGGEGMRDEAERLAEAAAKLRRTRPGVSPPTLARGLERLGFPASAIYRFLQSEGDAFFAGRDET